MSLHRHWVICLLILSISVLLPAPVVACTGIKLVGADGTVVFGRTQEWGKFDLKPQIAAYPSGTSFQSSVPGGDKGIAWKAKYGLAGVLLMNRVINTGMNEAGLAGGMFFHKGFAEYAKYDAGKAAVSMAPSALLTYILSNFATVDEVKQGLSAIRVVPVVDPALGIPFPLHAMITDPAGNAIVIEFKGGKAIVFDNPVGVITNNPTFDWQLTNLRNYGNLSNTPFADTKWGDYEITPLAGGSGMLGLPGDFTSPSRFVRAAAFVQTARKTTGGEDTVQEAFRILDSFDLSATQSEGSAGATGPSLLAGTQYTVLNDTKNKIIYYHTMFNRRVRMVDLTKIDFKMGKALSMPLDQVRKQDVDEVTGKLR
ncbi:linear amide C-N hydrolase [Pseudodesulfovibrio cashew]|uniref:Linear amide C-N hydrolase n=1 Tax=Pseudodesulfovibrio cashew TaxID=2678688 RepID=A0A6I6JHA9_9BACT|nr:choloylglycine hydrolase family protein [Pseudodesulfovibrio cashew]QGY40410.1 linear amide C-N hydrolase [Pseudodesulfovibrio cashew]